MARSISPLRYPGGKTCLYPLVSSILRLNDLEHSHYAEPFAGGGGLALALLYEGHVSDIHINDVDPAIWSFWYSALHLADQFAEKIATTPATVEEWRSQRQIHAAQDYSSPLTLGFATFFLNRTNRSGIIKDAGVIGGIDQTGNYKIDCRFNREDLAKRIRRIAKYKDRIHLTMKDGVEFLDTVRTKLPAATFLCIDPPYFNKGSELYTSFYEPEDHKILADSVLKLRNPWIVTYDNVQEITELYQSRQHFEFDISYSVETKRRGTEVLITSSGLKAPSEIHSRLSDYQVARPSTPRAGSVRRPSFPRPSTRSGQIKGAEAPSPPARATTAPT